MATSAPDLAQGLAAAMALAAGERIEGLKRLSGGASQETWAFRVIGAPSPGVSPHGVPTGVPADPLVAPAAPDRRYVLRRAPPGAEHRLRDGPSLADEAQLVALAAEQGVPVAPVVKVLQPADGLGSGFIGEWVEGETLGGRIAAEARPALAFAVGRALARIHAVPLARCPALRRTGPAAEVAHLKANHARNGAVKPIYQLALRWLAERAPADGPLALVHGDFRNGNLMVDLHAPRERLPDGGVQGHGGLVAVLDWELAHFGDPMADLGWLCVNAWRYGQVERRVGGFGDADALFAGYRAGGGQVDEARVHWWQVLGSLRWGTMCEGMGLAWLKGHEPVMEKAAIGRRASEADIDLMDLLAPRGPSRRTADSPPA